MSGPPSGRGGRYVRAAMSGPPGGCDAETSTQYVLCCFLGPGVPWSEDPLGTTFSEWCKNNLKVGPLEFNWIEDVGEQMNEFVTAQSLRPGTNPYVKPIRGCDVQPPTAWRCTQTSKLSVRLIRAKPEYQRAVAGSSIPPGDWAKLWCAVKVERKNPLCIKPVSRADWLRSHQNDRLTLFANEDLMQHVFVHCKKFLNMVRDCFDKAATKAPNDCHTGKYLSNFMPLVSESILLQLKALLMILIELKKV